MNETRLNRSILQLPTEVCHLIFDYLDCETIFKSIAPVCQIIRDKVNSYNRLKLHFSRISPSQWSSLAQAIQPENVIIISLSVEDDGNSSDVNLFFSLFQFDRFVRLKTLKLIQVDGTKFDQFFGHIIRYQLKSLSIAFAYQTIDQIHSTIKQISSMIGRVGLEKINLTLPNGTLSDEIVLKSIASVLKRLEVTYCTYEQFHLILLSCVNLKTLIIKRFDIPKTLEIAFLPFVCSTYPQLSSLTLELSSLNSYQLSSILTFTPSLVYLQLDIDRCESPDMLSGYVWEKFIRNRLSHLKIFRFWFIHQTRQHSTYPSLRTIIQSFRTSFWLNEKRWMIVCDYLLKSSDIHVYTRSFPINDNEIVIRSPLSTDHYQLIKRKQTNHCESLFDEQLTTLDLSSIHITNYGLSLFVDLLNHNTMLRTLKRHGSNLSREQIFSIVEVLSTNETITTLDFQFGGVMIYDKEHPAFPRDVDESCPNWFGAFGMSTQCQTDRCEFHSKVGFNQRMIEWPDSSTNCFTYFVRWSYQFADQYITDEYVAAIANTLKVLYLRSSEINPCGAKHLANALRYNSTLITLDCRENKIGDEGVEHLANALKINSTLTTIDLQRNRIDASGCEYLAKLLQNNHTLETLNLKWNSINDQGAQHLAQALHTNQTLQTLDLSSTNIGKLGAQYLIDGLIHNQSMIALHLQGNRLIDQCQMDLVNQLINRNEKLRQDNRSFSSN